MNAEPVMTLKEPLPAARASGSGRVTVIVMLMVGLCVGAVILAMNAEVDFNPFRTGETTDDAYIRADQITLSSHIAGYIETVPVEDNQRVEAGQVIARIRRDDFEARLTATEANLRSATSALAILTAQLALQQSRIASAKAAVRATKADFIQAEFERTRQQALVANSYSAHRNLEAADAAHDRLSATMDQRQADVLAAKQNLDVIEQQITQARAIVTTKAAARDLARIELGYTEIRTPIAGQLSARAALVGEYVEAGTKIGTVVPLPNVWVVANFREAQMARIQPGEKATFTVDSVPGVTFRGHVDSCEPLSGALQALLPPDNATGNFTKVAQRFAVKITLLKNQSAVDRLRPGMSAIATVSTASQAKSDNAPP